MELLETKLEAVLFYKGEAESKKNLAKLLEVEPQALEEAANQLRATLAARGIRLLSVGDQLELVTAPETSEIITRTRKEELTRDLGKAGADTLAIILYRDAVTRADIEYIRGVNCSFILRNLMIRGLVEKVANPANARSVLYRPTTDLLKHLGVTTQSELPEYAEIRKTMDDFEERKNVDDAPPASEVLTRAES
jgi:segregation and condensation protein B